MLLTKYLKYLPYLVILLLALVLLFGANKYKKTRDERLRDKELIEQLQDRTQQLEDDIQHRTQQRDSLLLIVSLGNQKIQGLESKEQQLKDKLNEKTTSIPSLTDDELQRILTEYPQTRRRLK